MAVNRQSKFYVGLSAVGPHQCGFQTPLIAKSNGVPSIRAVLFVLALDDLIEHCFFNEGLQSS
jgi:hypothetical protein